MRFYRAREKRPEDPRRVGMAEVADTMPPRVGALEWEMTYRRTNYIHEMSCGDVGSHLYSRMCCAGRCERVMGGGSGREGLLGMLLTLSVPPPTRQQAPGVKSVGAQKGPQQMKRLNSVSY